MLTSEATFHLGALEVLLGDLLFQVDDAIEHRLGFCGDIHRAGAGLVLVQRGLGSLEVAAYGRNLLVEEFQALGRFCSVTGNVLIDVAVGYFLQHADGVLRIRVFQGHVDDARLLAALGGGQALLIALRGVVGAILDHGEGGAGASVQLGHGDAVAFVLYRLAGDALYHHFTVFIAQDEAVVLGGFQRQLLAMHLVRYFHLGDLQHFATPGVSAEAGRVPAQLAFFGRLEASGHEAADDREVVGLDDDVKVQVADRATHHRARLEQRDLGLCRRYRRVVVDHVGQARQAALGFDLDHRAGEIDRCCEQRIGDAQGREEAGDAQNEHAVVDEGVKEVGQVDVLVLFGFIDWAGHGCHRSSFFISGKEASSRRISSGDCGHVQKRVWIGGRGPEFPGCPAICR